MLILVSKLCGLIFPSLSRDFSNVISVALSEIILTLTAAMSVVLVTSEYLQKLINSDSILFNYFTLFWFTWSNLSKLPALYIPLLQDVGWTTIIYRVYCSPLRADSYWVISYTMAHIISYQHTTMCLTWCRSKAVYFYVRLKKSVS